MLRSGIKSISNSLDRIGVAGEALESFFMDPQQSVHDAIDRLDTVGKGIVLVVDSERRLLGTITDGDVRRWMLAGHALEGTLNQLLQFKTTTGRFHHPVTAPLEITSESLLRLMQEHVVHQVPLLDAQGRVAGLVTMDDLLPVGELPVQAVIMAGGFGTRLRPLTIDLPKPMLPVGDRPLLEHIVRHLQSAGIRRVNVTTHFMPEKIKDHFGNGDRFGMRFNYISEEQPLGTAGALSLLEDPQERILVMNGDILTSVDFKALLQYHNENEAALTVGVRKYEFKVPYGVVEREGPFVTQIVEKPSLAFFVNAGIYLLESRCHALIPRGQRFDMTDLISLLLRCGHKVACFPILEYWLDIGQHHDYEKAVQDVKTGRFAA